MAKSKKEIVAPAETEAVQAEQHSEVEVVVDLEHKDTPKGELSPKDGALNGSLYGFTFTSVKEATKHALSLKAGDTIHINLHGERHSIKVQSLQRFNIVPLAGYDSLFVLMPNGLITQTQNKKK